MKRGAGSPGGAGDLPAGSGVLAPSLRRDLADLNRQFLDMGVTPEFAVDSRFVWTEAVRRAVNGTDAGTRDRMAGCPFALFQIELPVARDPSPRAPSRIEDAQAGASAAGPTYSGCLSFLHAALFVAWRLADSAPLAARLALGLPPAVELRLSEMSLSELTCLAATPGLIRPRWAAHAGFWAILVAAAEGRDGYTLQQAHCVGICLLDADLSQEGNVGATAPRHKGPC